MAVREVVDQYQMIIDWRRRGYSSFDEEIPHQFVCDEGPNEIEKINIHWERLTVNINKLCKMRRNIIMTNALRKTAFESGIHSACRDFSRRQENLKVELLLNHRRGRPAEDKQYCLLLTKLSPVPDNCRYTGASFVAEIPSESFVAEIPECDEHEAHAVWVENRHLEHTASSEELPRPTAPTVIEVEETQIPLVSAHAVMVSAPCSSEEGEEEEEEAVTTSLPSSIPLQRMKHLESIKLFLSEDEYQQKRMEILNSI